MVHARAARAYAKSGDLRASRHAEEAAFAAYHRAGHPDDEPACVYWVCPAELHSWAASNASDLGDPRRALAHYAAAVSPHEGEAYDDDAYPRSRALRLSREAHAHLAPRRGRGGAHGRPGGAGHGWREFRAKHDYPHQIADQAPGPPAAPGGPRIPRPHRLS